VGLLVTGKKIVWNFFYQKRVQVSMKESLLEKLGENTHTHTHYMCSRGSFGTKQKREKKA